MTFQPYAGEAAGLLTEVDGLLTFQPYDGEAAGLEYEGEGAGLLYDGEGLDDQLLDDDGRDPPRDDEKPPLPPLHSEWPHSKTSKKNAINVRVSIILWDEPWNFNNKRW